MADASHAWEVINAGGISYASYRAANVMEELAQYEPDLFVVYTGHNEFLERRTYGQLATRPSWVTDALAFVTWTRTATIIAEGLDRCGIRHRPRPGRAAV